MMRMIWAPLAFATAASTAALVVRWFLTRKRLCASASLLDSSVEPAVQALAEESTSPEREGLDMSTVSVERDSLDAAATVKSTDAGEISVERDSLDAASTVKSADAGEKVSDATVKEVTDATEGAEWSCVEVSEATEATVKLQKNADEPEEQRAERPPVSSTSKSAAAHTYDKGYARWEKLNVDDLLKEDDDDAPFIPEDFETGAAEAARPAGDVGLVEQSASHAAPSAVSTNSGIEEVDPREEEREKSIARQVLDHLEQQVAYGSDDAISSTCEGDWHNLTVQNRIKSFTEKLDSKQVKRLFAADMVIMDKLGLNSFDALVVSSCLLERNRKVTFLNLNSNPEIGFIGAQHLASVLRQPHPKLNALSLSGCRLGDQGIAALVKALPVHNSIEILELRQNCASDTAAHCLAEIIERNESLESVYLNNDTWSKEEARNHISDGGAWALAFAMVERRAPLKVRLGLNAVTPNTQKKIQDVLGRKIIF